MEKIPVKVECETDHDGECIPKVIVFSDGRSCEVSKVLYYSSSYTDEYEGIRYTILIGSAERYIYRVNHDWYVMA